MNSVISVFLYRTHNVWITKKINDSKTQKSPYRQSLCLSCSSGIIGIWIEWWSEYCNNPTKNNVQTEKLNFSDPVRLISSQNIKKPLNSPETSGSTSRWHPAWRQRQAEIFDPCQASSNMKTWVIQGTWSDSRVTLLPTLSGHEGIRTLDCTVLGSNSTRW